MTPISYILPNNMSMIPALLANLTSCKMRYPNLTSYLKADIPAYYHYNTNRRITPIVAIADLGWSITTRSSRSRFTGTGSHGYDNRYASFYHSTRTKIYRRTPDMRGIFLAYGPNIKVNHTIPLVENLDVYNLVTHILDVPAAPNNGTMTLVDEIGY